MKDGMKTVTVILGVLSFFSSGVLVLALSDIHSEYLSSKALKALMMILPNRPSWTHCQMEWIAVGFAVLFILAFHVSLIIFFIKNFLVKKKHTS